MAGESGRPHRKLEVWQKSMRLVKTIYELTIRVSQRRNLWVIKPDAEKCGFDL